MMGVDGWGSEDDRGEATTVSPLVVQPPKLSDRPGWRLAADVAGKLWNAPNTALGLLYGGAGMAVGEVSHLLGLQKRAPGVQWRDNAVQFTNNPLGGAGAVTIGNTTTYSDDPYSPEGRRAWARVEANEGHPVWEHERQHTIQGQQLGPLYLPSNLLGGVNALLHGEDWWGKHNWNERGPKSNPPRPWANDEG
ncbi:MAG: repeat protein [Phenylobacterium sp.]|nr:repeat protein [Phenylobacterium sp.]